MLNAIVRFSLCSRGVIYVLAIVVAYYGLYTFTRVKLDVLPEFAPSMSIVHTETPGLTGEQIGTLVAQPLENALGGIVGL